MQGTQKILVYASCRRRFVAALADSSLITLTFRISNEIIPESAYNWRMYSIIRTLMMLAYFASFESSRWQASLGKKMLGIYVGDEYSQRISPIRALGRYLILQLPFLPISALTFPDVFYTFSRTQTGLAFLAGGILSTLVIWLPIVFMKEKTGVHDFLTKTRVFKEAAKSP